ncbi:hypothetical protein VTN77DRAFT_2917 [Rasamsonia byssochlamydoides]|uniref:uncharacterized protein n=1 Tax=Rasamsonia byssochlamydoides TaxID=89139 RepID=UPI00374388F0
MSAPPPEHPRATEMIYCLLKYEVSTIFRRSPYAASLQNNPRKMANLTVPTSTKEKLIDELELLYEQKYLQHCDSKIPLHHLAIVMAKLSIYKMRFVFHHPRHHPNGASQLSPEESDTLFFNSVRLIEYDNLIRKTKFSEHLLRHMTARTQLDALIYMLNELRRRTTGELVTTAWEQVEMVFNDHPRLIEDTDNRLYIAIGDLTLKAWEARVAALASKRADTSRQSTPNYILALLSRRISNDGDSSARMIIAAEDGKQSTDQHSQSARNSLQHNEPATNALNTTEETASLSFEVPSADWTFWEDLLQGHEPEDFGQPFFGQSC